MGREKPGIPKGTRDFNPLEVARREYIFDHIKAVFRLHGFMPIETPAMENLQTLMGKYGEEGDRLIFRILNSGDFAASADASAWENRDAQKLASQISEKALRYDLTVPFARYVVQYQNDIVFPFKRYQIQPVWRADRPQKGRYREFFQCDVDVIGSDSLTNELEFIQIISEVFHRLKVAVVVKLNNRKVLAGLAEYVGHPDKLTDITVAIDKMDKIGLEKVNEELALRGLSQEAIEKLRPVMELSGTNSDKLSVLRDLLAQSETGLKGVEELREVFALIEASEGLCEVELDLTLARGLNYYTGAIIEVKAKEVAMGSICGGGRYDDLTGVFGLPGTSGVGISFGADRIYDVLLESGGFPEGLGSFSQVLAINFGPESVLYYTPLLQKLRGLGVRCELYPDPVKIKKQMQYADKNRVPFVIMAGEEETARGMLSLKDMKAGTQEVLKPEEIARRILEYNA